MFFFFSSRRRHTRFKCDWSSDVCSSDLSPPRKRLRGREDRRSDVAYATPHFCLTSPGARSRHHYGERTVGTLDGDRYDALHALESRFEGGCRGKTGKHCYKSATPCTRMQQQGSGV